MKNLKKNLLTLIKDLKAQAKKVDKIMITVDKLEKSLVVKKQKSKIVKKKSVAKKASQLTAIDIVHGFIKKSSKGIDAASLVTKTGFNKRKIYDIVKVLKKRGMVKSKGIGIYVKVAM